MHVPQQQGSISYAQMSMVNMRTQDYEAEKKEQRRAPLNDFQNVQAKDLNCVRCSKTFTYSVEKQLLHKQKGYMNTPSKCDDCKDPPGMCNLFQNTGECRFGSECRFSHCDGINKDTAADVTAAGAKVPFSAAPGSIEQECRDFPDCRYGDMCAFTHKGRERQQNVEAVRIDRENVDKVALQGMTGLRRRQVP